jgi:hypothetical protein
MGATLCQLDGLLIKCPSVITHFKRFECSAPQHTLTYSLTLDYACEPQAADTACRMSSNSTLNGILQYKTLCEAEKCRIYKYI